MVCVARCAAVENIDERYSMRALILQSLVAATLISVCGRCLAAEPMQLLSFRGPAVSAPVSANADSALPILSPDGRFVLFASSADDLLVMTNGARMPKLIPPPVNVFLRDRTNATTTLVSVNLIGTGGGNGVSLPAGLSPDGCYVLFESSASDLAFGDTNGVSDVFMRDVVAGITIPVSVSTNGDLSNGASRSAVMTPDGRYVAFVSAANNLVAGDTNGIPDVFLRDLQLGTTVLVSVGANPGRVGEANGGSGAPAISADGRYVAFYSTATNLVPGATNVSEIYVRDVVAGTTAWASAYARTALQSPWYYLNLSFGHTISIDGQFVTYEAVLGFLPNQSVQVPISLSFGWGVILRYNVSSGLTDILSTNAAVSISAPEDAPSPVLTPDGRYVAYVENATIGTKTNTCIMVWDAQMGNSVMASGDLTGAVPSNSISCWPAITADGRFVAFLSNGTNLVTNSLTGEFHLYVRDLQAASTTLVDAGTNGVGSGITGVIQPRLSDDGSLVAFEAQDGSLVQDDANNSTDIFLWNAMGTPTERISRHDPALPSTTANGPSSLSLSSVSAEGSFVAFSSEADNLVLNDTNGYRDVFVRDLLSDTTLLVSVDMWGAAPGNGVSCDPAISADGRYVVFTSSATNLVAGDTNNVSDVFVRDLLEETTQLVSINVNGVSGNAVSYSPMISADGRAVLFHSQASDLAPDPFFSGMENVFWRDLWSGVTYILPNNFVSATAVVAATMTPSGRFVVLGSQGADWYVWDSQSAATVYAGTTASGNAIGRVWTSADGNRIAYVCGASPNLCLVDRGANTTVLLGAIGSLASSSFSADGRYLAYATTSANTPADTNGLSDVYLYDCQAGSNVLVSQAFSAPASANGHSDSPVISLDGRFVAYRSAASNLVPNDANGVPDIFLWDRVTGATLLMSLNLSRNSTANNRSLRPVFTANSRTLVFESWASDMISGDFNCGGDLFAVDIYASGPIPLFKAAIVSGADSGQGVWISWPTISGKTYRLEFKDNPSDPVWQPLGGTVTILGQQGYLYDLAPGSTQRFYRVVAQ
jgi:Tol biopolymer transport system component